MPNGKPDPKCKNCNGTGQIILFTSSRICECVSSNKKYHQGEITEVAVWVTALTDTEVEALNEGFSPSLPFIMPIVQKG